MRRSQGIAVLASLIVIWGTLAILHGAFTFRFNEVAQRWGFVIPTTYGNPTMNTYILESTGNGAAIFDFNGDGRNDVLITNGTTLGTKPGQGRGLLLYRNEASGLFTEVGTAAGLDRPGWGQAACAADIDNDGDTDLLVTYYGANRLYQNTGGRFMDITRQARLPVTGERWGSGCAWTDYDRDGFVDLFIANYVDLDLARTPKPGESKDCIWKGMNVVCGPVGLPKARNALYRNLGNGVFQDVSAKAGILKAAAGYGLGVTAADFNNDGWPDIYVACDQTPSLLYQSNGDGTFVERGVEAGIAYNADGRLQAGMGVAVGDIDGNGFLDVVKTNFSGDLPSLYLNEDGRFFRDAAREGGLGAHQLLGWGVALLDADEDGRPDLLMVNGHVYPEIDRSSVGERYRQPSLIYRNVGEGRFVDGTAAAGPALNTPRPSRGLALGDLDGDGRPEAVIVAMNEVPAVLKNTGKRGNWLRVVLQGTKSNRSAIGARVTVEAGGHRQIAEVAAGGSYYSQHEFALYFGLGQSSQTAGLTIRWPNGTVQKFSEVAINRTILYRE